MQPGAERIQRPLWMIILVVFIGIILVSGIIAVAGQIVYAVVIFPALMGLTAGFFAWAVADSLKLQRSISKALFAATLGIVIYGLYRYFDYLLVAGQLEEALAITFEQYIRLSAQMGTSISRLVAGSEVELSEMLTWIYWLVEIVIIDGIAIWVALKMKMPEPQKS